MICCKCHKEITKTYGRVTDLGNYCKECAKQNEVEAAKLFESNMENVLEIEKRNAVKEFAENKKSLYDCSQGAYMTSKIGDLPLTVAGLRKAVDEITRLNNVEAELQELNIKYYNEAKDSRRELAKAKAENEKLKAEKHKLENDLAGFDEFARGISKTRIEITGEAIPTCKTLLEYIKKEKRNEVEKFAEKLKEKFDGYDATSYNGYEEGFHDLQEEIDELLKEYINGKN